jgi:hypothetical protein
MLKRGVKKITIEPDELERFEELFDQAMTGVDPKILPRGTLQKVKKKLDEFKKSKGESS